MAKRRPLTRETDEDFATGDLVGRDRELTRLPDTARSTGEVVKHLPDKGFGFIRGDNNGREYFVHHSATRAGRRGFDALQLGQHVSFIGVETVKGWRATDVVACE